MQSSRSGRSGSWRWTWLACSSAGLLASVLWACGNEATSAGGDGGSGGVVPDTPCETEGEVRSCYPGSPLTANIGECHNGTTTCNGGVWGACLDFQLPGGEVCNGLDDDCNGQADDGCTSTGGGGTGGGSTGGGGAGGSGAGGSGGAGGSQPTSWSLYHRNWGGGSTVFSSQLLSDAWQGANAPPSEGIIAADVSQEYSPTNLFVVDEGGTLYVQQGSTWLLPRPVSSVFPGVDGTQINCMTLWRPTAGSAQTVEIIARGSGNQKLAYFFNLTLPNLGVTADAGNPILITDDGNPESPPQHQSDCNWMISRQTAFLGTAHWVVFYMQYELNAYELDGGDATWTNMGPAGQSGLWGSQPASGPTPGTVTAAWLDGNDLYFVAP